MQLEDYLRVMIKRWYVPALLLLMALLGAYIYTYVSATRTAEGQLAIPLASFTQFDNMVNGQALSERVAEELDDGTTADEISGQMAGNLATSDRLLPAYGISATDEDPERALLIANTAMDEAIPLWQEIQEAQAEYVRTSFEEERNQAEEEALAAQAELDRFLAENNAYALPTRIAQQADLVAELRLQVGLAPEEEVPVEEGSTAQEMSTARAELERLLTLEPEYNRLQLEVRLAESEIESLEAQLRSLQLGGAGYTDAIAAVEAELESAKTRLTQAKNEITTFESGNGITDLPATIREQQTKVNDLLLVQATEGEDGIETNLATAEATLEHLQSLQPEYNRLARAVEVAEKELDIREEQQLFVFQSTLPTETQIEVIERASLKSVFFWTAIRYTVAIFLAVFVSLILIYGLALLDKAPPSMAELEEALGKPVIARVPRTGS